MILELLCKAEVFKGGVGDQKFALHPLRQIMTEFVYTALCI